MNTMEPYSAQLADVYDMVYTSRGKDYQAEAEALTALVHARRPAATSLLDVACGTGEHLRHLHAFDAEGVELADPMRAKATAKGLRVHAGDMRNFTLGRTFDVVACLFSSIGYMRSVSELRAAARSMADHLEPGGLLIVDPWFHPDDWEGGHLDHTVAIADGRTVLRLAHSTREGRTSRVTYHYLTGDTDGITTFVDKHEMTLFTREEYTEAITRAGCAGIEYVKGWEAGRDRVVAVKTAPADKRSWSEPGR
nr:class I SAM-dependent methyltransferase [Kibdelosporangium sp. MJ126-NF4]CEL17279.1 N, N-dimethyltransferase [Kibdelosporangium sp. MJ126-NF4]CTQ91491.1 N, N-dimethyltransferase [Kibdelosporangium sp. MJ126-NF4]